MAKTDNTSNYLLPMNNYPKYHNDYDYFWIEDKMNVECGDCDE